MGPELEGIEMTLRKSSNAFIRNYGREKDATHKVASYFLDHGIHIADMQKDSDGYPDIVVLRGSASAILSFIDDFEVREDIRRSIEVLYAGQRPKFRES
jgi:hypothetical protein